MVMWWDCQIQGLEKGIDSLTPLIVPCLSILRVLNANIDNNNLKKMNIMHEISNMDIMCQNIYINVWKNNYIQLKIESIVSLSS